MRERYGPVFFQAAQTSLSPCCSSYQSDELYRSKIPAWKSTSWKPAHHRAMLDAPESGQRPEDIIEKRKAQGAEGGDGERMVRQRGREWTLGSREMDS